MREIRGFRRECIQVRRLNNLVAVHTHTIVTLLIRHDKENIGALLFFDRVDADGGRKKAGTCKYNAKK